MSTKAPVSGLAPKEARYRTNSLGFAKIDCHTCAQLDEKCDRKRPQCGTCLSKQRKCGGFVMDLMWKDPVVPSQSQRQLRMHSFKFVRGRTSKKRHSRQSRKDSTGSNETPKASDSYATRPLNEATSPASSSTWSNDKDALDTMLTGLVTTARGIDYTQVTEPATQPPASELALPTRDFLTDVSQLSEGDDQEETLDLWNSFPLQVMYENLAHKYHDVLDLYNEHFCVVPLSHDCQNNPFRMRLDFTESFTFLLHAVLAISSHHLAKTNNCSGLIDEMQKHWCTAIRLFSTALGHCNFSPLLDTLLILINIESTQSAYGMSDMHLRGAHRLLGESSAAERCLQSPRLRAQLAMLIWWDVTASLISRREPRLPTAYLETLASYDDGDGWSFFTLTGCPIDLVKAMWRLSRLAHVYERSANVEWTMFNLLSVDFIADDVKNYINYEDFNFHGTGESGAHVNARRNRFHCIEAWRHGILLYVARVFTPKQDSSSMECIDHYARVIIDSVRCIPPTDAIQKQLLLPVFLAASELGDDVNRAFVREYCRHWNNEIHFYQFETVTALLDEVWSDWDEGTRDTYWWGIKTRHDVDESNWMARELLLG